MNMNDLVPIRRPERFYVEHPEFEKYLIHSYKVSRSNVTIGLISPLDKSVESHYNTPDIDQMSIVILGHEGDSDESIEFTGLTVDDVSISGKFNEDDYVNIFITYSFDQIEFS